MDTPVNTCCVKCLSWSASSLSLHGYTCAHLLCKISFLVCLFPSLQHSPRYFLFPNIPTSHTLPGISSLPQYPSLLHPSRYFLFSSISQPLTLSQVFPHVSTCILVTTIFSLTFKHVTKYRNFVAFRTMPITPPRL